MRYHRPKSDDFETRRRWMLVLFELGATVPVIARVVRKDRTTVRYHLRESGVFEKKGRAA